MITQFQKIFLNTLIWLSWLGVESTLTATGFNYRAAGILPYAFDADGNLQVLLGLSSVHNNKASDFGGYKDPVDSNNPYWTAAREACEELMFIFDTHDQFLQLLVGRRAQGKNFNPFKAGSKTYHFLFNKLHEPTSCYSMHHGYQMHFINIDYQPFLPELFACIKDTPFNHLPKCWHETSRLAWTKLDDILHAIHKRADSAKPIKIADYYLFEPFVQSLITAQATGIIAQIKK